MRRDSPRAKRLAEATGASPRQLEEWSHTKSGIAYLGSEESPADEAVVKALLTVGTERRDRVNTTLILASRFGLACHDFKEALCIRLQLGDPELDALTAPLEVDETSELSDLGTVEAERRAIRVEKRLSTDEVSQGLLRNIVMTAPDYHETPEQLWHSWITTLVTLFSAGRPSYTPALPAMLGIDAVEVDHLGKDGGFTGGPLGGVVATTLEEFGAGFSLDAIRRIIDDVPAGDLARLAPGLRPTLQILAGLAHVPFDPDRDESAACSVPVLLAIGGLDAISRFAALPEAIAAALVGHPPSGEPGSRVNGGLPSS